MASAKFFLKSQTNINPTLIFLIFHFNYFEIINGKKKFEILKVSTGEKILPKYWNPKTHLAGATDNFPQHAEMNTRLKSIAAIIEDEHRKLLNDGIQQNPDLLRN